MSADAPPFATVSIVGLGLIGSSIARAARAAWPGVRLVGHDADAGVRDRARAIALGNAIVDDPAAAVAGADLVVLCVPVGAMDAAAAAIAPGLGPHAVVSDVGSSKAGVAATLAARLPGVRIVPAHPVAGTEQSGPDAGFATLFRDRWCILTPAPDADGDAVARVLAFWTGLGARAEVMDAARHDLVLAVTSHLPHLLAFAIVGTASDLEAVTAGEVIKYSAGGFRDFTRIAASDPTMWRDVFLHNREAVLAMLDRFLGDVGQLAAAIRVGDGDTLFRRFAATRAIRRSIVDQGQDDPAPDFGRRHD